MKIIFTPYAKWELEDAIHYYELEFPGLGQKFKEEVKTATLRIAAHQHRKPDYWIERHPH